LINALPRDSEPGRALVSVPWGRDELFELTDAVLCTDSPVKTLVELVPAPEHQRRHGALDDGTNHGGLDIGRLRRAITETPLPRAADGRLVLTVDVSPWLRPDANTSPDRPFCHTCGHGKDECRPSPLHRSRRGGRPFGVGQGSPKRRLPET
jgi:hypothetical protein